jgi:hypothetical protein
MDPDYADLAEAGRSVCRHVEKLYYLRDETLEVRDRVGFESSNCIHQRQHLSTAHRELLNAMSNLLKDSGLENDTTHSRELDRIRSLHRQLEKDYESFEEQTATLRVDEDKLSRLEYLTRRKEAKLGKASKKMVRVIKPLVHLKSDGAGTPDVDSDSVRSFAETQSQVNSSIHPKQREYFSRVADEEIMLERYELTKEDFNEQHVDRNFKRDQGMEPEVSDEDFDLQRRTELLLAAEACEKAAELVESVRKECLELGLELDVGAESPVALGEVFHPLAKNASPPEIYSPAMSGLDSTNRPIFDLDQPQEYGSPALLTAQSTPLEPEIPFPTRRRSEQRRRADSIGHWIQITREQASDDGLDPNPSGGVDGDNDFAKQELAVPESGPRRGGSSNPRSEGGLTVATTISSRSEAPTTPTSSVRGQTSPAQPSCTTPATDLHGTEISPKPLQRIESTPHMDAAGAETPKAALDQQDYLEHAILPPLDINRDH